jgi:hypothetical protein
LAEWATFRSRDTTCLPCPMVGLYPFFFSFSPSCEMRVRDHLFLSSTFLGVCFLRGATQKGRPSKAGSGPTSASWACGRGCRRLPCGRGLRVPVYGSLQQLNSACYRLRLALDQPVSRLLITTLPRITRSALFPSVSSRDAISCRVSVSLSISTTEKTRDT